MPYARGWCTKHYKHWSRHGDPLPTGRRPGGVGKPGGKCSIPDCARTYYGHTWCRDHYTLWRRSGDPLGDEQEPKAKDSVPVSPLDGETRHCKRCQQTKPLSDYYNNATGIQGVTFYCKLCINAYDARRRERDPVKYLADKRRLNYISRLKTMYDMTLEDYDDLLAQQGGLCRICGRTEREISLNGNLKPLCVDHDHCSGKVRGLLCHACNKGLGSFEDDVSRLRAAADYLSESA